MRALTILYHDVINENFDESGFTGPAAARYKMTEQVFADHLELLARSTPAPFTLVSSISPDSPELHRLLTFDDGGVSAIHIADRIEELGWRGHFFITTDYIDTPGFLSTAQLRDLSRRGHIIGSHSRSHPPRISELSPGELTAEWSESIEKLSSIIDGPITTASVPGGYYTKPVAEIAASVGIKHLFTSEPTIHTDNISGCEIFGRYNIYSGMSAETAGSIVAGKQVPRYKQKLAWNLKKTVKYVARPIWERARTVYFGRKLTPSQQSHVGSPKESDPERD